MSNLKEGAMRQRLRARQQVLEKAIEILQRDDDDAEERPVGSDTAREQLDSVGNEIAGELLLLRAALSRIDEGSFGTCVACSEELSEARLEACPYALLCESCAIKTGGESAGPDLSNRVDEKIEEWQRSLRSA